MASEAYSEAISNSATNDVSVSTIQINVKTLDSQIHTIRVDRNMPVRMVKEKIVEATSVPVEQQRLIFNGRVLRDDHALSEYHLEDGHTLHLVMRQPTQVQPATGGNLQEIAQGNSTPGNDLPGGAPRSRVLLGAVNLGEQNGISDIGRIIGTVLNTIGIGSGNISAATIAPPPAGMEGTQNAGSRTQAGNLGQPGLTVSSGMEETQNAGNRPQAGNPGQPGVTIPSHLFQVFSQLPPFPLSAPVPHPAAIPDSLATLAEYVRRMELVLQNGDSQPSSTPPQDLRRSDVSSMDSRGLPTPEALGSVIGQVHQLLSGNASTAVSRVTERLQQEAASPDPSVRSQIQTEVTNLGFVMQHLGVMFLELGRTMTMLRMGQSPAESFVNAGPAVYISPTGPNPIMVQAFPPQMSSSFGVSQNAAGVSSPFGSIDPSRNINIHIVAGSTVAPGVSAGTRSSPGEARHDESTNVQQASTTASGGSDSSLTRGVPSRTIVAAIPTRSATEGTGHALSVVYPVHVRSQQSASASGLSGSSQVSYPTGNGRTETSMLPSVPQTSSESGANPTLMVQLGTQIAGALGSNVQTQVSSCPSGQTTDSRASNPAAQSPLDSHTIGSLVLQTEAHEVCGFPGDAHAQSSLSSGGTNTAIPGAAGLGPDAQVCMLSTPSDEAVDFRSERGSHTEASVKSLSPTLLGRDRQQPQSENGQVSDDMGSKSLGTGSLNSSSSQVMLGSQSSTVSLSKSVVEYADKKLDSSATTDGSQSSGSKVLFEGERPGPLGLGLAGLQPKRRGKLVKPKVKDEGSCDTASVNQNKGSVSRGQHILQALASQGSDGLATNDASSVLPLPQSISQMTNDIPLGGQGGNGQADIGSMMTHVLQMPAFDRLLTGVAEQAGVGSPANLRSMLEQCTRSPAVRNTLNQIVHQVDRQGSPDLGGMLSSLGGGQGGMNLSKMIQQMLPVVSQALGRGAALSTSLNGVEPEPQIECANGMSGGDPSHHALENPQVDLHHVVERIQHRESAAYIFRSVLESAARLDGEESNYDLVEGLGSNVDLANDFLQMLKSQLHERVQRG